MAKNSTVRKANGTGNVVLTKTVDEMSSNLNMVSETISELKKGLEILKDEPGQIIQERSEKMIALHSAPCYTTQCKYKYFTRLYLQGDGIRRSTHVSLFVVVMKSKNDKLLN